MTEVELLNDPDNEPALRLLLAIAVVVIIVGGGIDLAYDAPSSWLSGHVFYELALIACGVAIAVAFWRGWRHAARSLTDARRTLVERQAERDEWRSSARQALEGLGHAIEAQFEGWALTPAEREIALLLLKGHSHKAIAYATGRSERTVRQHAVAAYQKSGLRGRAELAAFFLEDLMLPEADRELSHARPEPPVA